MGEGEPVGSISEEGIAEAGIAEGIAHFPYPKNNWGGQDGMRVKEGCEPSSFMLERESSESAEDERQDEDGEPKADRMKELEFGLKRGHLWEMVAYPRHFPVRIGQDAEAKFRRRGHGRL